MEFSKDVQDWFVENFGDIDIEKLSLEELKTLKNDVVTKRTNLNAMELGQKLKGNAGYGACGNPGFYFYNVALAGDITGECRELTKFMAKKVEDFFKNDLWERKDLWEKLDIDLDQNKKEQYQNMHVWIYSDTDSIDKNSLFLIKENNNESKIRAKELWEANKNKYLQNVSFQGHEILNVNNNLLSLNYKDNKLCYSPIKRIIRHKVSKPKFKIKTKSGKEIIVTGDHSCIVFRDGVQLTIKAKDINIKTDKILSVIK